MTQEQQGTKVLVDAYNIAMPTGTGIATYARSLAASNRAIGNEVALLFGLKGIPSDPVLGPSVFYGKRARTYVPDPLPRRLQRMLRNTYRKPTVNQVPLSSHVVLNDDIDCGRICDKVFNVSSLFEDANFKFHVQRQFTRLDIPGGCEIAHFTYHMPILVSGAKNICTVHDVIPLILPHCYAGNVSGYHAVMTRVVNTYDHIVTISESSRNDIINLFGVSPDKVSNTYMSSDVVEDSKHLTDEAIRTSIKNIHGLDFGEFFLFYSAIEPKKNLARLIEAYCASGVERPLVVVGKLSWMYERELQLIDMVNASRGGKSRIVRIDYLPRQMLLALIRAARAILFPSLYEGFGLPILEGMLLNVPVMTAAASSTQEVAGDAALLVNPYDIRDMAQAIASLDANNDLRARLAGKGIARSRDFSPARYQSRLKALYADILGK